MNRLGAERVCTRCGDPLDTWTLNRAANGEELGPLERLCSKCLDLAVEDIRAKAYVREKKAEERMRWKEDRRRRMRDGR